LNRRSISASFFHENLRNSGTRMAHRWTVKATDPKFANLTGFNGIVMDAKDDSPVSLLGGRWPAVIGDTSLEPTDANA
jgi:hypothetical protein